MVLDLFIAMFFKFFKVSLILLYYFLYYIHNKVTLKITFNIGSNFLKIKLITLFKIYFYNY
jgi:hypothetical protein